MDGGTSDISTEPDGSQRVIITEETGVSPYILRTADFHIMELLKKIKVKFYEWVNQFLEPNGQAKSVHTQMLDFKVEKLNAAWNAAFNTSELNNTCCGQSEKKKAPCFLTSLPESKF